MQVWILVKLGWSGCFKSLKVVSNPQAGGYTLLLNCAINHSSNILYPSYVDYGSDSKISNYLQLIIFTNLFVLGFFFIFILSN
jgi:hypothetical protein